MNYASIVQSKIIIRVWHIFNTDKLIKYIPDTILSFLS
ncbi:hypothetical protein Xszus_01911 [Xenorhabdus szentirmaii]|nr:hypothetical protein Xsze_02135 [Xenorhabdus szentirmaii DSM 16338]PHM42181.1 hypothetical protein Xszus_01911 [Xenorhabdus szentirmaii]